MYLKTLLSVLFISLFPMNVYSRALRHIDMNDVKQKHQQKLAEQKTEYDKKIEEKKYIEAKLKNEKYDWRKEINESIANKSDEKVFADESKDLKYEEYNWRDKLLSDKKKYFEGMTSAETFFTTLPATGDVDLQVTTLDANGYQATNNVSFGSGNNSGFTGGFSAENGIINLNGEGEYSTGVVSNYLDLSIVDSINITAIAGNNSNGGMTPTAPLQLSFYTDTDVSDPINVISQSTDSFTNLNIPIPPEFRTKNVGIVLYSDTSDGFGFHGRHFRSQTIPISGLNHTPISGLFPTSEDSGASIANQISFYLRTNRNTESNFRSLGYFLWFNSMNQRFGWFDNLGTQEDPELVYRTWPAAPISGATKENDITDADYIYIGQTVYNLFKGTKLYGISNISLRRKSPMNVFVSLDSPEATAFIRSDPFLSNLSPEQRLQKLKEMLEASDEYVLKVLGIDFPGTGAVPPGEAGDTPGVETIDYGTEVGQISQGGEYPESPGSQPKYNTPNPSQRDPNDPRNQNRRYDPHMGIEAPNIGPGYSGSSYLPPA